MPTRQEIERALESIFSGIAHLKGSFPSRKFTIDGRLVGDIGEVIAAMVYEIVREAVCGSRILTSVFVYAMIKYLNLKQAKSGTGIN